MDRGLMKPQVVALRREMCHDSIIDKSREKKQIHSSTFTRRLQNEEATRIKAPGIATERSENICQEKYRQHGMKGKMENVTKMNGKYE